MSTVLCAHADSAVDAWNKRTFAVLTYELLPFRTEPDARTHGYSLRELDVSLGQGWVGSHGISCELQEYANALLCDVTHVTVALLTCQSSASACLPNPGEMKYTSRASMICACLAALNPYSNNNAHLPACREDSQQTIVCCLRGKPRVDADPCRIVY